MRPTHRGVSNHARQQTKIFNLSVTQFKVPLCLKTPTIVPLPRQSPATSLCVIPVHGLVRKETTSFDLGLDKGLSVKPPTKVHTRHWFPLLRTLCTPMPATPLEVTSLVLSVGFRHRWSDSSSQMNLLWTCPVGFLLSAEQTASGELQPDLLRSDVVFLEDTNFSDAGTKAAISWRGAHFLFYSDEEKSSGERLLWGRKLTFNASDVRLEMKKLLL